MEKQMLLNKKILAISCLAMIVAAPTFAEEVMLEEEVTSALAEKTGLSGNVTLISNYVYRGISQTAGSATPQGGVDYAFENNFYIGAWTSGVSIFRNLYTQTGGVEGAPNSRYELDTYAGYKNHVGNIGYDIGYLRYNFPGNYPGTKADTDEIYGELKYKIIAAKYSYSLGNTFANPQTRSTNYFELNALYPVESAGVALGAHYGKQTYKGVGAINANGESFSYSDYKLSVTKEFMEKYEVSLAYSKTNATAAYTALGRNLGKGAFIASVTRVF
jgi:uncharacterized protein (TIGR02001 family)